MASEVAEQPEPDSLIGQTLANRYLIEVRLGEGAMGTVYRAKHVKVGRPFAVKVLHRHLLEDNKVAQRFEREAELAGRLRHPNVIGVVDVGETPDGFRYMVMDFAEGDDLAAILDQAPMTPARIIHLTRQLLEGLYHAHEQGLIHRDFKPENVIVETDMHGSEVPRIVDFGIAILREGGDSPDGAGRLTTNGLVLGTPHYMAPEQAVADPIDHRIDLFALGIVIYEMLCGKLPYDGTGAEVARANLLLDPPPIAKRVPYLEVDPLLEAFARRLMAKKRDHRPATAKAARDLLDLIERDRAAAGAALGVPLEASTRMPAVTQPQTPQPRHADQGSDTFPPPITSTLPRRTDLEAPAVASNSLRIPSAQRDVNTAVTDPLDYQDELPRSPARRWIFAGIGLVVVGGIAAFALGRGGGGDKPTPPPEPPPDKVVMQTSEPPKQPALPPEQPKQPVITDHGSGSAVPEITQPEIKQPEIKKTNPGTKIPKGKDPKTAGKTPEIKQPEIKQPEIKQPEIKQPEVKQPEVVKQTDSAAIAAKYSAVGKQLAALGAAANDLWPRYRMIRIQEVMSNPAKQSEAAGILSKLERDIAALKK
jgi:serine/threonine protein kinase